MMSALQFTKIERKSLAMEVYNHLRQSILLGAIPPGVRILEAQVAKQMSVSRAPVREALRMLESDRLVSFQINQGAYVRRLEPDEIWEIYTARSIIEGYVAGLAAIRAKPEDLDRLQRAMQLASEVAKGGDIEATIKADFEIHRMIWEISGHKLLCEILKDLDAQIRMFMAVQAPLFKQLEDSVKGHDEIVSAIEQHDSETARRSTQQHIIEAGRLILNLLKATGENPDSLTADLL